ncbi:MAG: Ig-like domain repeat protein [Thermoleophilia bacterium]|nr:Ig-like domain repeat protein [Thermoleophilia bacterium]
MGALRGVRLAMACAVAASVVLAVTSSIVFAGTAKRGATGATRAATPSCVFTFRKLIGPNAAQNALFRHVTRACRATGTTGTGASKGVELPTYVPDRLGDELGDRKALSTTNSAWASLGATLAATSTFDGPKGGEIGLRMIGAPRAARVSYENGASYVAGEFTAVQSFHGESLKESIVVPKRLGTRTWSWKVSGGALAPRLTSTGAVDLRNGLFIPAPVITDAKGAQLKAPPAWTLAPGGIVSITLNDKSYPTPYVVDPGVAPTVGFTGFTAASGNTYIDPTFSLTRIFVNTAQSGTFTVNAATNDADMADVTPVRVCFPTYGAGWTADGGCVAGTSGASQPGILATYYSGNATGSAVDTTFPSTNFGANPGSTVCGNQPTGQVGPFSRIENSIDSYANWGNIATGPTFDDDAPYPELCDEQFSAKYKGTIRTTATSGNYYFGAIADDGVRVSIYNGTAWVRVLSEWTTSSPAWHTSCAINLAANTAYPISVEYFENTGQNRMQLRWNNPGSGAPIPAGAANCYAPGSTTTNNWVRQGTTGAAATAPWIPVGVNLTPAAPATTTVSNWPIVPAAATAASPGLRMPNNVFSRTYSWNPGAASPTPATQNIVAEDDPAPDTTPGVAPFTVIADATGPVGGSISVDIPVGGGLTNTASARLDWSAVGTSDGAVGASSGIAGTGSIWRQDTPFDNGNDTCDAFPATWTAGNSTSVRTGLTPTSAQANDNSLAGGVVSGKCYRWALVFTDNVGNIGTVVSQVVRVDGTAPTGIAMNYAEVTGNQWMFASGGTMFYNPSAGNSGSFNLDASAGDLESGVDRVQFPATGSGWNPNSATIIASAPFSLTYAWNSSTVSVGPMIATVRDVAGNAGPSAPYNFTADTTPPSGGSVTYANGVWGSTAYNVGINVGADGTGSGVASWLLQRQSAALPASGICDPFTNTWGTVATSPSGSTFADTLTANNCYQWRLSVTDNVGNVQTYTSTNVLRFDELPPVTSILGISSAVGNVYRQPLTSNIWVSPTASGSFSVQASATDAVGMDRVIFPATGAAGWSGPTPTDITTPTGSTYTSSTYSWSAGASDPTPSNATARDTAGNTATAAFDINLDTTPPLGAMAEPSTTVTNALTVPLALTSPIETQSGVQGWSINVQQAPFTNGACGVYGAPTATGLSGVGAVPATATATVAATGCYRYSLVARDNVGNASTGAASVGVARIDLTNPAPAFTSPSAGSAQTGTFTISGTVSEPTTSVASGSVTFTGPAAGTACASLTFTAAGAGSWTWTCSWVTPLTDGTYNVTVSTLDAVGNPGTATRSFLIDNSPPVATWTSWTESSAYLFASTTTNKDLLWYNPAAPAGTTTATATVTATDAGSGMKQVAFPNLGAAGWGAGGNVTSAGAGSTWAWGYTFTGGGAIGDPALTNAVATDIAGAATGAPALNFRVEPDGTAPTGATFTSTPVLQSTVSITASANVGTDAGSGVGGWRLDYRYAVLTNGTCGTWDPWNTGSTGNGFAGAATDGQVVNFTIRNDDANNDGVPDYTESFCFQTQLFTTDNVGNVATGPTSGVHRFDFGNPTTTLTVPTSGSGSVAVSGVATDAITAIAPGYPISGSGLDQVTVTYLLPDGPDADTLPDAQGTICTTTTFTGAWTSAAWNCAWVTGALPDGLYTISAVARDNAGRTSVVSTSTILLDNQAPVVAWHSWDNSNPATNAISYTLGQVLWVNSNAAPGAYTVGARVTAYDLGAGMNRVDVAGIGAGWTPSGASTATLTSPSPVVNAWTRTITFATPTALTAPGTKLVTAVDNANNSSTTTFEIRLDGTAPTGGAAAVTAGRQANPNVAVAVTAATEGAAESGLKSWTLQYDTANLANDTCGAFVNVWTTVSTGVGIPPAAITHDVTALGSQCFRYRLVSTDNVGNMATSAASASRRVDLITPLVAITSPANGIAASGALVISGTASDSHTGIDHVKLEWLGPLATSGSICDPATLAGTSPSWTFSCSWSTALLPDGTYTVRATSYDRAGNVSSTSDITVLLDNQPPFIAFYSFTEATPYTYWAGPVGTNDSLWYNPSAPVGSYAFDVNVTSYDMGSGVSRVEFDGAGAGWTPGAAVATDTNVSPTPTANSFTATYAFNTAGAVATPPTLKATAYDPANNPNTVNFRFLPDTAQPTGGAVSYANGYAASTSVPVSYTYGTDGAGSGIANWQLYRSDATLSAGACSAWGAAYSIQTVTGANTGTGGFTDTATDQTCVKYEWRVTDNVGNVETIVGSSVVKFDLVPPTGSITLAPTTNPGAQLLVNPTRIIVNTNVAGSFTATATGAAASGVLATDFPTIAAGFTAASSVPGPGPNFPKVYAWSAGAGTPATGLNAIVRSNSLGTLALPFEVIADPNAPTGGSVTHAFGFTTATSLPITYAQGSDASAGVDTWQLQRETGTLAGGACTWSGGFVNVGPASGAGSYTDTLAQATCYRYRMQTTDKVGNVGYSAASAAAMVDQTAPTSANVVLTTGTNPAAQYLASSTSIWINPTLAGSFTATVTATDPESGTGAATFPALGAGWTTGPGATTAAYSWVVGAAAPGSPTIIVANGSGLTTTIPFTVLLDGTAPTGATLDQQSGFDTNFSVDLSYAVGGDGAGSGIGSWRIERRSAAYNPGTSSCGAYAAWGTYPLPTGHPTSPYIDLAVTQPTCYQYRLVEVDRVGNQAITIDGDTIVVINDVFPPAAFNLVLPTNPALPAITTAAAAPACGGVPTYASATPIYDWTDSSDAQSGLDGYDVVVDAGAPTHVFAPTSTLTAGAAVADGAHSLAVRALDNQANFTNAGPAYPAAFRVDTTAPTATTTTPANASWTISTTPTLVWNATDTNCVARVEIYVDNMATPLAVASGSETSWTPSTALAEGMHTWKVVAIDSANHTTSSATRSFGVDTTAPGAFAMTSPTGGETVRGFINVTWTASSDAGSGLGALTAYEVWVDGSLKTTVGSAITTANIPGITNGIHAIYVRAVDLVGNSTNTASATFTGYGVIPAPTLVLPVANAKLNAVPTLSWTWPSDGGPAPTTYDVLIDGLAVGTTTHPTTTLAIADPGDGNHTWQIRQNDPYTGVTLSATRTFLLDRTAPTNAGPLTRVATTVSWPAAVDPAAPIASGIATIGFWINGGSGAVLAATLAPGATSYNYGTKPDGIYTMFVRAIDSAGNATNSPSLVVTNDPAPPLAFNLNAPAALPALPAITDATSAPACESAPTYATATPTLTWQASSDATSGLAGYDVYVDGIKVNGALVTGTSWSIAPAIAGGAHTWYVVATDNFGLTRTSSPASYAVRVDGASPAIGGQNPANASYTADTTPTLSWSATDDNCVARVEVTVDGSVVATTTGSTTSYTPTVPLSEGSHSWSLRLFDSAGNVTSGASRTVIIDTIAPASITAITPVNASTTPEGYLTFTWSAGTDAGSGVSRYDLYLDGTLSTSNLAVTTSGTYAIHAGPHTWMVRAYDAVGNGANFTFTYTASVVVDTTAPNAFNLLTPIDNATITSGTALTWAPSFDFNGIANYRVLIDGALAGTVAGNVNTFTPTVGAGTAICSIDFDPASSAACISSPTYTQGAVSDSTTAANTAYFPASAGTSWGSSAQPGYSASGNSFGVGNTTSGTGWNGDRQWTAAEYTTSIPAGGADVRFEHRYDTQKIGSNAYDGGAIEIMVDSAGDGFANDTWATTCNVGSRALYGASMTCAWDIVEPDAGGFNAVLGGPAGNNSLAYQATFSGNPGAVVQTKVHLSTFAGKNVRFRFKLGGDSCYVGQPTIRDSYCPSPLKRSVWQIDNLTLANPALLPGAHTWKVQAVDPSGNLTNSNQTWTFNLL